MYTNFCGPAGCWTRPTPLRDIDLANVHGHIFILTADGVVAYEYREGSPINMDTADDQFIKDFFTYLSGNGLANVLGLQLLHGVSSNPIVEFVLENSGTVMLDAAEVRHGGLYRCTGWSVTAGGTEFNGGESHAKTNKGTHQVFIGGKPLPDIAALKSLLHNEGII